MALVFENSTLQKLFGSEYTMIGVIPVDVVDEEQVTHDYTITNKPAEDGTVFSDNIIENPTTISFNGIISGDLLGDTWLDKKSKLDELRRSREPFAFVGILGTYENIFFSNIKYTANNKFNSVLRFSATLQQVPIIKSATVTVPAKDSKNPAQQSPSQSKGKVQPTTAATTNRKSSILSSITGIGL